MFKIGDIVRFIEDDDEWKIIGVGREGGDIAYMVIGLPYLVSGTNSNSLDHPPLTKRSQSVIRYNTSRMVNCIRTQKRSPLPM